MKEVILCKYGEIILKGANRSSFEAIMLKELRRRAKRIGEFEIYYAQSTVFIEPINDTDSQQLDDMFEQAKHVFGFVGVTRAIACEKSMDVILQVVKENIAQKLDGYKTFKAEAKRSDKKKRDSSEARHRRI